MTSPRPSPFPPALRAPGTADAPFEAVASVADLPKGAMLRVSRGDLDVLIAHCDTGLVATEDRCPHMSAPLTEGRLEGCLVHCPLHHGAYDLRDGDVVTFPTTGGLDAEGRSRSPWTPEGSEATPPPADAKARARARTRVRRMRFLPLRIRDGMVEVALPR
jgi:nitrite reductase/ring-hydroxylating ferredoxin subunit